MSVWWWVGYTDRTRPVGRQALGAIIVKQRGSEEAKHVDLAIRRAGIHPGGEALYATIDESWGEPPTGFAYRLLNAAEAETLARLWDPGHGGLAGPDDIRKAFLDDDAKDGQPLFRGRR